MGKNTDEEQNLPGSDGAATASNNRRIRCSDCCCERISNYFNLKYHRIVASFNVERPVSFLEDNLAQLENDITDEISFPMNKVVVLDLERVSTLNRTRVVFTVDPEKKNSIIPAEIESLIKSAFETLVQNQLSFHLTESLFGEPFRFEVLKFPGGITVIPPQPIFPLQKAQILFNFTLNFSIFEIQSNFDELISQLKKGINLAPYENLYITLSNSRGSTVSPPTIVHSSVLLKFGTYSRMKQLSQTITNSHSKNLGLNHTVFGKVKQVRLSSVLPPSPSPSPQPGIQQHRIHHKLAREPLPSFARAPAPTKHSPLSPRIPPRPYTAPKRSQPHPPAPNPIPPRHHAIPVSSPLPYVEFAHIPPPSSSEPKPTAEKAPSPSSTPSSASIGRTGSSTFVVIIAVVFLCL